MLIDELHRVLVRIADRLDPGVGMNDEDVMLVEQVDANTMYLGYTQRLGCGEGEPFWKIKKLIIDEAAFPKTYKFYYANGNKFYKNKWTLRATYTYS